MIEHVNYLDEFVSNYSLTKWGLRQGERGHWAVYYTSFQSFIIMFSYSLAYQLWGHLFNFDWLFH